MSEGQITIQDLVAREVIYCVSALMHELPKKSDEFFEEFSHLYESIDYEEAESYEIEGNDCEIYETIDNCFGVLSKSVIEELDCDEEIETEEEYEDRLEWIVEPEHACKEEAIRAYFEKKGLDIQSYTSEVYEHWIVSEWLANRLEEYGEAVDKDVYGMCVWGRTTTGAAIYLDWVIEQIYQDLIKRNSD